MPVEFSDGDSWWFRPMRIGDTVFCQPDAATKYGLYTDAVIRDMGVTFVHEVLPMELVDINYWNTTVTTIESNRPTAKHLAAAS